MKRIFISLITFYQVILSPILRSLVGVKQICRYSPTCSEYAKQSIQAYGALKGISLAAKRLLSCQPFGTIQK